jgi:hypothetical protein
MRNRKFQNPQLMSWACARESSLIALKVNSYRSECVLKWVVVAVAVGGVVIAKVHTHSRTRKLKTNKSVFEELRHVQHFEIIFFIIFLQGGIEFAGGR